MRPLGPSGLAVPAIGLGTWSVFDTDQDLRWLVDEAIEAGANLFDSSPMYGRAEDCLARALSPRRSQAIVATKVSAVEADKGEAQIAHALGLYGTIDLYQIHNIVSWKLHLPRLEALKKQGLVGAIGASQGLLVSDEDFIEVMRTGLIDSVQIRYNPNRRDALNRILPLAADMGLGVIVMQPLRWGVLLASPTADELAELKVTSWGEAIQRWILADDRVTTILSGTATPGRITTNAAVGSLPPLEPEQKALVEAILARGPSPAEASQRKMSSDKLAEPLRAFLSTRLGACYCDACIARQFATVPAIAAEARAQLPAERFVNEQGPCLACGEVREIARSKTIIR